MFKIIIILIILLHIFAPDPAYAPVQDSYRVEVLQARVNNLLRYKLKCILKGWDPVDENIWR
uniref:Uncharacterized protein n=1 Tax=viral metagenome TaxID=1070528 RepID=A0A6H1ZYF6_9ZZZZ